MTLTNIESIWLDTEVDAVRVHHFLTTVMPWSERHGREVRLMAPGRLSSGEQAAWDFAKTVSTGGVLHKMIGRLDFTGRAAAAALAVATLTEVPA